MVLLLTSIFHVLSKGTIIFMAKSICFKNRVSVFVKFHGKLHDIEIVCGDTNFWFSFLHIAYCMLQYSALMYTVSPLQQVNVSGLPVCTLA